LNAFNNTLTLKTQFILQSGQYFSISSPSCSSLLSSSFPHEGQWIGFCVIFFHYTKKIIFGNIPQSALRAFQLNHLCIFNGRVKGQPKCVLAMGTDVERSSFLVVKLGYFSRPSFGIVLPTAQVRAVFLPSIPLLKPLSAVRAYLFLLSFNGIFFGVEQPFAFFRAVYPLFILWLKLFVTIWAGFHFNFE
jgi:hypothetical protein